MNHVAINKNIGKLLQNNVIERYTSGDNYFLYIVGETMLFITEENEIPILDVSVEYQRPLTILLSLFVFHILQYQYQETGLSVDNLTLVIDRILDRLSFLHDKIQKVPIVKICHRFPPKLDTSVSLYENLIKNIDEYFDGGFPITNDTRDAFKNYILQETSWIISNKPPLNSIKHINGIHDLTSTENILLSLETRQKYRPAFEGSVSIVTSWKQYEYAVTRFAAKLRMKSWMPFIDLTDATTAAQLENHTAFVMKFENNIVLYAFAIEIDTGTALLKQIAVKYGFGDNYDVRQVLGYKNFLTFIAKIETDILFMFNTSSSISQGSSYRCHVFASK